MEDLLLLTIFLPLLGAALMWVVAPLGDRAVRWTALGVALVTLAMAGCVVSAFPADGLESGSFAVKEAPWLGSDSLLNVQFATGLDGLGVWMFGLSALLMVTAILVSWESITDRPALFYGMLLLLEFGCLGVFCARDIILFYVFFEFTLIPLFFLIGVWGSEQRRYAAVKFFLFTLAGSVLTFLGLLALVYIDFVQSGGVEMRFSIPALTQSFAVTPVSGSVQLWIFLALFAGFAIKVPLFPLHTWLPLAHVQAPTAGSVFLAGVLLKIGTYGFLRFCVPMLPDATAVMMPWIMWLSVAGIIYGALVALVQTDMKRLIAYSSVSHLGYCMIGLFALNQLGVQGGALQMVNHGISTGGLFAIVGMIYERRHTREISQLRGLAKQAPCLAFAMILFTFSSIGLPGLNGFAGEFLVLLGVFQRAFHDTPGDFQMQLLAVLAVSGVVLGAWYMLYLVQRTFFGQADESKADETADMKPREMLALAPLVIFIFWIGLQPKVFLDRMGPTLRDLTNPASQQLQARHENQPTIPPQADEDREQIARVR